MSRGLGLALSLSLVFHLGLAAYFMVVRKRAAPLKHGTIAVDLIESVPHEQIEDPHHHPGKKARGGDDRAAAPKKTGTPGDPRGNAAESDRYILTVTQLIHARKIYPRRAVEREEEGRVVVGVTLDREGHVVASRIETPSPFDSLNEAALDTIKAVAAFPPIPEEVPDPIHLHVPLVFKIKGR